MNRKLSPRACSNGNAFTLIELLVVISIIAVLAGLLLPVGQKVLENSRKVVTKNTESQIITAINSYQTEYGQYPVDANNNPAGGGGGTSTPTDVTFAANGQNHNNGLFDILRGNINSFASSGSTTLNVRRIVYFEGKNVKNPANARDGFIVTNTGAKSNAASGTSYALNVGDLVDPWGNVYAVRLDTGYDNQVKNPYSDPSAGADTGNSTTGIDLTVIRTGIVSWTYGADGKIGAKGVAPTSPYSPTPGDDVDSWQ